AAQGVTEGSETHRRLRLRVLGAGALASVGLAFALAAPRWSTRLIDLGPSIYARDRKSTRLNSSHGSISYAVFCLKKKKQKSITAQPEAYLRETPVRTPPATRPCPLARASTVIAVLTRAIAAYTSTGRCHALTTIT